MWIDKAKLIAMELGKIFWTVSCVLTRFFQLITGAAGEKSPQILRDRKARNCCIFRETSICLEIYGDEITVNRNISYVLKLPRMEYVKHVN